MVKFPLNEFKCFLMVKVFIKLMSIGNLKEKSI